MISGVVDQYQHRDALSLGEESSIYENMIDIFNNHNVILNQKWQIVKNLFLFSFHFISFS